MIIRALRDDVITHKPAAGSWSTQRPVPSPASSADRDTLDMAIMSDNPTVREALEQLRIAVKLAHGDEMSADDLRNHRLRYWRKNPA